MRRRTLRRIVVRCVAAMTAGPIEATMLSPYDAAIKRRTAAGA